MCELINDMLDQGVVISSASPWASPIVLVAKKDGSTRFCVDHRKLNAVTKLDVYPLPCIDDSLDLLADANFFTSLDLASGYWQVGMRRIQRENSVHYSCGAFRPCHLSAFNGERLDGVDLREMHCIPR